MAQMWPLLGSGLDLFVEACKINLLAESGSSVAAWLVGLLVSNSCKVLQAFMFSM